MAEVLILKQIGSGGVDRLNESLAAGGLACLPSDTVYGLAGLAARPAVREQISGLKGREPCKPLTLVFKDVKEIIDSLPSLPTSVRQAMVNLLPGGITAVIPATPGESAALGLPGQDSVGVRVIPPPLDKLYRRLPGPLFLTSANFSGSADPRLADEIPQGIREACDFVVDAGRPLPGAPSTVVDLRPLAAGGKPVILREGALPGREIEKRLESCGCF